MRTVSRTELQDALTNMTKGIQRQPVVVRDDGEDVAVLMSIEEYDRILGRNLEALRRFCDQVGQQAAERGMTEEKLAEILADDAP
jgi:PHD/YefM family antitoxin component YafN of YafNO toxin-antitoxin module